MKSHCPKHSPHHRRSILWSAESFDADYYAHQQHARERLQKRRCRPRSPAAQERFAALSPGLREMIERDMALSRHYRAVIHRRLRDGYRWPGGNVNGQPTAPFSEHGLRSSRHPMLRLFVAGTQRARKGLRAGDSKAGLVAWGSKLLLLDQAYVSFNRSMRRVIRIDIDKGFNSWDALREAIAGVGLPPPNLAVARVEQNGRVLNPHGYWLLAQAVCCTTKGRLAPQRLLRGVERAMVEALDPVGADAGGLSNPHTGKNPLSPLWSCQVMSAAPFNLKNGEGAQPGLIALVDHVGPTFGKSRSPAAFWPPPLLGDADTLAILEQSNGLFEVLKRFTFAQVARFHPRGRGEGDFEDFERATIDYACALPAIRLGKAALYKLACRQAAFVWRVYERASARPGLGRCRARCEGKSLREKQQIGALAVAEAKRQRTIVQLVEAYRRLVGEGMVAAGSTPRNGIWAAKAGVTVRTLQKHRAALQATLATGGERSCIDKKQELATPKNHNLFHFPPIPTPKSLPAGNGELVCIPQHSDRSPVSPPPLALLTIASPARRLRPGKSFAPSGDPMPPAPSWLAGLVLVLSPAPVVVGQGGQSPALHLGSSLSFEAEQMLTRAGFVRANARKEFTLLPTTPHAPLAFAEKSAATAPPAPDPSSPGTEPSPPIERTQRDLAPGFVAAPAARLRHWPPDRLAASPRGRLIVGGGVLDQNNSAEPPGSG